MSFLSSPTMPFTMSTIAKQLGTLDIIRFEISANEGGTAGELECLQNGQYHCISLRLDILVKNSYPGMDILRQSMQSHFSYPSYKTASELGSRPILQSVQKSRDLVGLHNFCLHSCLEAILICDRIFRTWGG